MKINGEFILREIMGESILIPTGRTALKLNGMVTLNPVGACIWRSVEKGMDREAIISAILDRFDTDRDTAEQDMDEFLNAMKQQGLMTD